MPKPDVREPASQPSSQPSSQRQALSESFNAILKAATLAAQKNSEFRMYDAVEESFQTACLAATVEDLTLVLSARKHPRTGLVPMEMRRNYGSTRGPSANPDGQVQAGDVAGWELADAVKMVKYSGKGGPIALPYIGPIPS